LDLFTNDCNKIIASMLRYLSRLLTRNSEQVSDILGRMLDEISQKCIII